MIDEHICDGDIALIENRTEARDGEIVVALIDRAGQVVGGALGYRDWASPAAHQLVESLLAAEQ